ncbi:MAG: arsenite methyltransferase [Chloroflexi bacterium]|nr:arsenite methyltransferase [Chloroflexota bacterium]
MKDEEIRQAVRDHYGGIAVEKTSCCGSVSTCGCGGDVPVDSLSKAIGYSNDELGAVPDGANLGLGCGNPTALASLKKGETVLDLGSGAGFDCFLAANVVGETGRVIGIDMTPEMLEKARENARKGNYDNVEFRLGEIENIPAADNSVDVVISNCVINLSPDKPKVFGESFRVLKPGGRLMVSDIVLMKELPEVLRSSIAAYVGCISGALLKEDYLETIRQAGFEDVKILEETTYPVKSMIEDPMVKEVIDKLNLSPKDIDENAESVVSIKVQGIKPE